jgi:hypothetical protein
VLLNHGESKHLVLAQIKGLELIEQRFNAFAVLIDRHDLSGIQVRFMGRYHNHVFARAARRFAYDTAHRTGWEQRSIGMNNKQARKPIGSWYVNIVSVVLDLARGSFAEFTGPVAIGATTAMVHRVRKPYKTGVIADLGYCRAKVNRIEQEAHLQPIGHQQSFALRGCQLGSLVIAGAVPTFGQPKLDRLRQHRIGETDCCHHHNVTTHKPLKRMLAHFPHALRLPFAVGDARVIDQHFEDFAGTRFHAREQRQGKIAEECCLVPIDPEKKNSSEVQPMTAFLDHRGKCEKFGLSPVHCARQNGRKSNDLRKAIFWAKSDTKITSRDQ